MYYAMGLVDIRYFSKAIERTAWVSAMDGRERIVPTPEQKLLAQPHSFEAQVAMARWEKKLAALDKE